MIVITVQNPNPGFPIRVKITPMDADGVPLGTAEDKASEYEKVLADNNGVTMYMPSDGSLKFEKI